MYTHNINGSHSRGDILIKWKNKANHPQSHQIPAPLTEHDGREVPSGGGTHTQLGTEVGRHKETWENNRARFAGMHGLQKGGWNGLCPPYRPKICTRRPEILPGAAAGLRCFQREKSWTSLLPTCSRPICPWGLGSSQLGSQAAPLSRYRLVLLISQKFCLNQGARNSDSLQGPKIPQQC